MKKSVIAVVVTLLFIKIVILNKPEITYGPGVSAPDMPEQENIKGAAPFRFNGYILTPLANFKIKAKVLSKENYYLGREADLSPVDLALGWGKMSDESVIEHFKISQSGRWYRWQTRNNSSPIPLAEVSLSSANMHMVPMDADIESQLNAIPVGEVVELSGKLIRVDADDGWRWISSLRRDDTGSGACELMYVESVIYGF
ncbi:hypothetical protein [Aliikangiella sp. G2MR2-5]|uniref:hypothetical protein n=1 Tax=Aliikangiella sp. G2MR2-5 TaxID=2788943 RepID=UPI0018A91B21|nr:hypothetical protein [Aliikangiella sp. G2MR2-5]